MNNSLNMSQIQQNNGLNMQLNNEILKNKELLKENRKLNNIIQNQKNEIIKLKSELQKYININQNLNSIINQMNINMKNNQINNNEINNLRNENINLKNQLKLKDNEIKNLKLSKNEKDLYNINLTDGQWKFIINIGKQNDNSEFIDFKTFITIIEYASKII